MTADEQLWFAFGIGGALLFLEESLTYILRTVFHKRIPAEWPRAGAGLALFGFALYKLFTLPLG